MSVSKFDGFRPDSGDLTKLVPDTMQLLWDKFGGIVDDAGLKRPTYGTIITTPHTMEVRDKINIVLKERGFAPI